MQISKELISESVPFENLINREWNYKIIDNILIITYNINKYFDGNTKQINIYEFVFKLKEWAINEGYTIISGYDNDCMGEKYNKGVFGYCCQIQDKEFNIKDFYEDNEINAIIKACQYILDKRLICKI